MKFWISDSGKSFANPIKGSHWPPWPMVVKPKKQNPGTWICPSSSSFAPPSSWPSLSKDKGPHAKNGYNKWHAKTIQDVWNSLKLMKPFLRRCPSVGCQQSLLETFGSHMQPCCWTCLSKRWKRRPRQHPTQILLMVSACFSHRKRKNYSIGTIAWTRRNAMHTFV